MPDAGAERSPLVGRELWIERVKWGDRPHYRHTGVFLGEDEHVWWFDLPPGRPVYRGDVVLFHGQTGGQMLIPADARWWAWFPAHRDFDLYVDIVREGTRSDDGVWAIDMDLDVVRHREDGRVELVDEDELEEHAVVYGYTAEAVAEAHAAAEEVLAAVRSGREPFVSGWGARRAARRG